MGFRFVLEKELASTRPTCARRTMAHAPPKFTRWDTKSAAKGGDRELSNLWSSLTTIHAFGYGAGWVRVGRDQPPVVAAVQELGPPHRSAWRDDTRRACLAGLEFLDCQAPQLTYGCPCSRSDRVRARSLMAHGNRADRRSPARRGWRWPALGTHHQRRLEIRSPRRFKAAGRVPGLQLWAGKSVTACPDCRKAGRR